MNLNLLVCCHQLNPFVPNGREGVEKWCIGNKWVKVSTRVWGTRRIDKNINKNLWVRDSDQRGDVWKVVGPAEKMHSKVGNQVLLTLLAVFLGGAPTSMCHFFRLSVRPSVRRAQFLRNRTSSNHNFRDTCAKRWYLQLFFSFFEIFIFRAVRGVKGQKIVQNEK